MKKGFPTSEKLRPFSSRFRTGLFIFLLLPLLGALNGCSGEPDATFVDFSQKIAIKCPGQRPAQSGHFRVAVASMISAQETVVHYHRLLDYIAKKLGRRLQLVQRKTYREINGLIAKGQIDLAFICSGPYADGREKYGFKAIAMPVIRGSCLYRSYLIVNIESPFEKLEDLKGRIFAFSDPESNTGKLVPTYWLAQRGESPERFFRKTVYTYSHDNSIMAVALSLVDGAAVHGGIWQYYQGKDPTFTSKTKIIARSQPFGNPPVVPSLRMSGSLKSKIQELFLGMHRDPEGKKILDELTIGRFIAPKEECYDPVLVMKKQIAIAQLQNR